jgi:hypothetical protein
VTQINRDRKRLASLWLKNESMLHIPEDDWPPCTHGDDDKAAQAWSEITGLTVTIETTINTTVTPNEN